MHNKLVLLQHAYVIIMAAVCTEQLKICTTSSPMAYVLTNYN